MHTYTHPTYTCSHPVHMHTQWLAITHPRQTKTQTHTHFLTYFRYYDFQLVLRVLSAEECIVYEQFCEYAAHGPYVHTLAVVG